MSEPAEIEPPSFDGRKDGGIQPSEACKRVSRNRKRRTSTRGTKIPLQDRRRHPLSYWSTTSYRQHALLIKPSGNPRPTSPRLLLSRRGRTRISCETTGPAKNLPDRANFPESCLRAEQSSIESSRRLVPREMVIFSPPVVVWKRFYFGTVATLESKPCPDPKIHRASGILRSSHRKITNLANACIQK